MKHDKRHTVLGRLGGELGATEAPLAGITVLDLSRVLAGPWATQMLGDLGATVIKVERPDGGDDTRLWGPPFLQDGRDDSDAAYYLCANRNKSTIAVDFSTPEGAALIAGLAKRADILVENFKCGTLAKYGLHYAAMQAVNPRLIYCSITGFGQTGPYAGRGGYDFLIQAMSGLMSVTGRADGEAGDGPLKVGIPVSDLFTGIYAANAILAALHHRHSTGLGQLIDCALLDSQLAVMANQGANFLLGGQVPIRRGNAHPNVVPYRDFPTVDGTIVIAVGNDAQFRALCRLLDLPDIAADPCFSTNAKRLLHRDQLETRLRQATASRSSADLLAAMEAHGVPGGPINTLEEVARDPQVKARGLIKEMTRDDGTKIRAFGYPAQFSRSQPVYDKAPPRFAQDTADILARQLGLSKDEIDALCAKGVIATEHCARNG
ncbi:CaiB/BaiF CoA transferase family protein [Dongia sp.]|uniref:CaiB/BaiF CoA transferase family protein n=1 Tax=Dongia sp. TaxID=1977262 RepID=UPI0035ADD8CE